MKKLIIAALFPALLSGCSWQTLTEGYSPEGDLVERAWASRQLGTTRQSNMAMEQTDGTYYVNAGETVQTDERLTQALGVIAQAGLAYGGLGQLRRARPGESALAPISVDQFGIDGIRAQPITKEQQEYLGSIVAAEVEKLKLELEAAAAHEAAAAAGEGHGAPNTGNPGQ